jgi:hypothetical protein
MSYTRDDYVTECMRDLDEALKMAGRKIKIVPCKGCYVRKATYKMGCSKCSIRVV